jgi:hypothetical protein
MSKNTKWYNDGKRNYRSLPEEADVSWRTGRLPFWTDETTDKAQTTRRLKVLSGHVYKKLVPSRESREAFAAVSKRNARKRHEEAVVKLVQSPYWNGHYTRAQFLESTEIRKIHTYKLRLHRETKPDTCQFCGKTRALVMHHLDEQTDKYGRLDEQTVWVCKSCHASAHSSSGWHSQKAVEKSKMTHSSREWREKNCQRFVCWETGKIYVGMRELEESGYCANKVWCCCRDNERFIRGELVFSHGAYMGRKSSGGLHWLFVETPRDRLQEFWKHADMKSWTRSNQWNKKLIN